MTGEELFARWAPQDSFWSDWVAPTLFAHISCPDGLTQNKSPLPELTPIAQLLDRNTALILDLPGAEAIWWAVALLSAGYRPVLRLNTAPGHEELHVVESTRSSFPTSALDLTDVIKAICLATPILEKAALSADAPPVFLLGSQRMTGTQPVRPELFDNRWMVFPQDFPSAQFLKEQHITRVLLVQRGASEPLSDLAHVLLRWQQTGIPIYAKDLAKPDAPTEIVVTKPSRFKTAWYRALAILRLRRNSAGGFGAVVPQEGSWGVG
jgi:hypothetical protein